MGLNKTLLVALLIALLPSMVLAVDFSPNANINQRGLFKIHSVLDFNGSGAFLWNGTATIQGSDICTPANGLCAAAGSNSSWNQSHASTLYYSILNPYGFYNVTTLPTYPVGDNESWNQSLASTLYYAISNPFGFYNVTTLPVYPVGDNQSWNESFARTIFPTIAYVDANDTRQEGLINACYANVSVVNSSLSTNLTMVWGWLGTIGNFSSNNVSLWSNNTEQAREIGALRSNVSQVNTSLFSNASAQELSIAALKANVSGINSSLSSNDSAQELSLAALRANVSGINSSLSSNASAQELSIASTKANVTGINTSLSTNLSTVWNHLGTIGNWSNDKSSYYTKIETNDTIDAKIAAQTSTFFVTSNGSILGVPIRGNITNLTSSDGKYMNLSETASGFEHRFNFSNVNRFSQVISVHRYSGGMSHAVTFEIWNYDLGAWEVLDTFSTQSSFVTSTHTISNPSQYNGTDGKVQVRYVHPNPGTASHWLAIDQLTLFYTTGAVGGGVSGGGVAGYLPKWADGTSLSTSQLLSDDNGNITTTKNFSAASLHANEVCIGGDCKTVWPVGGGVAGLQELVSIDTSILIQQNTSRANVTVNASSTIIQAFNESLRIDSINASTNSSIGNLWTNASNQELRISAVNSTLYSNASAQALEIGALVLNDSNQELRISAVNTTLFSNGSAQALEIGALRGNISQVNTSLSSNASAQELSIAALNANVSGINSSLSSNASAQELSIASTKANVSQINTSVFSNLSVVAGQLGTIGNASKHVGDCGSGFFVQNITDTGLECAVDAGGSGGGFSADQAVNITSNVTFGAVNVTRNITILDSIVFATGGIITGIGPTVYDQNLNSTANVTFSNVTGANFSILNAIVHNYFAALNGLFTGNLTVSNNLSVTKNLTAGQINSNYVCIGGTCNSAWPSASIPQNITLLLNNFTATNGALDNVSSNDAGVLYARRIANQTLPYWVDNQNIDYILQESLYQQQVCIAATSNPTARLQTIGCNVQTTGTNATGSGTIGVNRDFGAIFNVTVATTGNWQNASVFSSHDWRLGANNSDAGVGGFKIFQRFGWSAGNATNVSTITGNGTGVFCGLSNAAAGTALAAVVTNATPFVPVPSQALGFYWRGWDAASSPNWTIVSRNNTITTLINTTLPARNNTIFDCVIHCPKGKGACYLRMKDELSGNMTEAVLSGSQLPSNNTFMAAGVVATAGQQNTTTASFRLYYQKFYGSTDR
jgi:hypothetical protein